MDANLHPNYPITHPRDPMTHPRDPMTHPGNAMIRPVNIFFHPHQAISHPQESEPPHFHASAHLPETIPDFKEAREKQDQEPF
jgi:hypothetical protein